MRTLVHLSDLHFGRTDDSLIEPLIACVAQIKPHVVVVSGDLTQRARTQQFKDARSFLDRLPSPQIVVPGNHDVPLYHVLHRALQPYTKYRRYISDDLEPLYADEEIAVLGVNTTRALSIKGGRINESQMTGVRERLKPFGDGIVKIIVSHHSFDLPEGHSDSDIVGRARLAMQGFASCGVDLLLAGHLHLVHAGSTAERYKLEGHAAVVVQAGTATSTRGRGEFNSFNIVRVDRSSIHVEQLGWVREEGRFSVSSSQSFEHLSGVWSAV